MRKIASPVYQSVDFLWKAFGLSMITIIIQSALLKFFQLISIKWIFSIGCMCLVYNFIPAFKKLGLSLILISLIFYTLMPLSVFTGKYLFEKNAESANQALSANLEEFQKQVDNIKIFSLNNLNPFGAKKTINDIESTLSTSLNLLINSLIKYFSSLIIMLVLTPLFFYTLMYLLIKYILISIGMSRTSLIVDKGVISALKRLKA